MTAKPRPKAITLTDAAADQIKKIMASAGNDYIGVRLGIEHGGCAGMSYKLEYAEKKESLDEMIEDKDITILIEPASILFLLGAEMDYKTEKFTAGFVFNNPNETDACGCGESVTLVPAKELS